MLGSWARTVVRALDARGANGWSLAVRAGVDPASFEDPDFRHPIEATSRLWRLAVEATGDPCFGLWASRFVTQTTFHALGFAVVASATLREAFERFVRYGHLVSDAAEAELRSAGDRDRLILTLGTGGGRASDEAIDAILSLIARTARLLHGDGSGPIAPFAVRLERPEPHPSDPFRKVFRAPVEFAAAENSIEYRSAVLDARLPGGNTELARHNDEVVARYLARIEHEPSTRLRAWLIDNLSAGEPSQEAAARALGLSLRNLQRRLADAGTTYRDLLSETRRALACSYLEEGRLSITEIAFLLGFADTSAFSRAFRRWTGATPSAWARRPERRCRNHEA